MLIWNCYTRFCVYLFRNPLNDEIFYIGEGTIKRAYDLKNRTDETSKVIEQIRAERKEPRIEILRDGLDNETALMYEGVAIDVIGLDKLTSETAAAHPAASRRGIRGAAA